MSIPKECKRLAEVDFPIAAINAACARENNRKIRPESGHISLLHTWWARRPLSSCRAVLLGILLPDPADPLCPKSFKVTARRILSQFGGIGDGDAELREALLSFLAKVSDFDEGGIYISAARELVDAACGEPPHVFDPFTGGGSIPLEALRLGCEATATELNPVAWLLLKITLEWSARKGRELTDLFAGMSEWVLKENERRLEQYYPQDDMKRRPLAYLWARKVHCEAPGCGVTIPLVRSLLLSETKGRKKAIRFHYTKDGVEPEIEVFEPGVANDVGPGTVSKFKATCPKCGCVTPRERVQAQLREKNGGASDAILLAVVRENLSGRGKDYYNPTPSDIKAIQEAVKRAKKIYIEMPPFPVGDTRAFPPYPYGINNWADVLTPRQKFSRWIIHEVIEDALKEAGKKTNDKELLTALAACLYAAFSDNAQYHTSLCVWLSEGVKSIFIQGSGIPMRADFVEGNPLSSNCEGLAYSIKSAKKALEGLLEVRHKPSAPLKANALDQILPAESVQVVFTDPPYYDSIPYAHLSDFFYGWLKLGLKSRIPGVFDAIETEKSVEITKNLAVKNGGGRHDTAWYEDRMAEALSRAREVLIPDGVGSVIFAHKSTEGWESLVSALIRARWVVTASWPILTERAARMRAQGWAALASSVHLVCRPRPDDASIGDWGDVIRELPNRIGDWVERLQGEGIRGADLVFSCIGPSLEIFSRYSKVETADGREVKLSEFFEKVWEVLGRTALEQILGTAEAKARNGAAGALEEDARLTALFLWTLQSTNGGNSKVFKPKGPYLADGTWRADGTIKADNGLSDPEEDRDGIDEDEEASAKTQKGFSLTFDVARRFAQPLGIHLPNWEGRIIKTEKGVVYLLSISERAKILFGEEGAQAVADRLEKDPASAQLSLFETAEGSVPELKVRGRKKKKGEDISDEQLKTHRESTTLDRVHAAMILQASGRANALRALLKAEQERGPEFLRLSNALTALYPKGSEEKRLLDAMLLAVPR